MSEEPSSGQVGSFYEPVLSDQELADLATQNDTASLVGELGLARVILRRVVKVLDTTELTHEQVRDFAALVLSGIRTAAILLRSERALHAKDGDDLSDLLGEVMDELGADWEVEL